MFLNKKGTFIDLKNMILILLACVFIFFIIKTVTEGGSRGADIAACRNWAVIESSAKVPLADIKLTNLDSPCVTFKDELKDNEFEVHETLAKGMYDVWKMYGQGKLDFFSDWDWFNKNTYCFIGDEITSDKNREINIDKFEEGLSNNYPPQNEQTYAEFFTSAKNTKLDFGSENIELKKDDKLYIIFTVIKKRGILNTGENWKSIGVGCTAGAYIGSIIPGVGTLTAGGIGCIGGFITSQLGKAPDLYPGLILVSSKDTKSLEKSCDGGLYYNPK